MLVIGTGVFRAAGSVLAGLLLADFISGVFHWFEDRYGNPKWPVLGHTIRANQEHHYRPRDFLKGSFWKRNREVLILGLLFLIAFWLLGWLNLMTGSAVAFGMLANELHRAAHRIPAENGRILTALQKTGLMQSFQHHARHHRKGKNTHYCVMTNYTNPLLEQSGFFLALERLIKRTTGIVPYLDESVNPKYRTAV